jgi:hypothetical protein
MPARARRPAGRRAIGCTRQMTRSCYGLGPRRLRIIAARRGAAAKRGPAWPLGASRCVPQASADRRSADAQGGCQPAGQREHHHRRHHGKNDQNGTQGAQRSSSPSGRHGRPHLQNRPYRPGRYGQRLEISLTLLSRATRCTPPPGCLREHALSSSANGGPAGRTPRSRPRVLRARTRRGQHQRCDDCGPGPGVPEPTGRLSTTVIGMIPPAVEVISTSAGTIQWPATTPRGWRRRVQPTLRPPVPACHRRPARVAQCSSHPPAPAVN